MNGYPQDWFRKLQVIAANPDKVSGTELSMALNHLRHRGRPKGGDAAKMEEAYSRISGDARFRH